MKPAGNSNDSGGTDDSDLEKMKQVSLPSSQHHQLLTNKAGPQRENECVSSGAEE